MKKKLLSIALAAVMAASFAGCGSTAQKAQSADTGSAEKDSGEPLIFAMELAYPPFEGKDENGDPSGISPDFAKAFGEYIGRDVEVVDTAWDGLIPSLQTGKADAVMSSMTITDERMESVDFSDPYAEAQLAILANADSPVNSAEDLNKEGMTVAVKTGSTGFFYAQSHLQNATIESLPDESACVAEVASGKADGFIYDQLTIYRNHKENPDTTKAVFIEFQDPEYWGIAVQKGNTELLKQLNEFIAQYKADGGFDKLTDKYLADERAAFKDLGFTWFFDFDLPDDPVKKTSQQK